MTKYEFLYGVTVEHFPNEKENVKEKLRLATDMRWKLKQLEPSYERDVMVHEATEAISWAEKILKDIDE